MCFNPDHVQFSAVWKAQSMVKYTEKKLHRILQNTEIVHALEAKIYRGSSLNFRVYTEMPFFSLFILVYFIAAQVRQNVIATVESVDVKFSVRFTKFNAGDVTLLSYNFGNESDTPVDQRSEC